MDLSKLTPAPWTSSNDAVEWTSRQRSPFVDSGAYIYSGKGESCEVVVGGAQDEQGGAIGVLRNADAEFIALARNDFDVKQRRGWHTERILHYGVSWKWCVPQVVKIVNGFGISADPQLICSAYEAIFQDGHDIGLLTKADKWMKEQEKGGKDAL